jgi:hypothetical protein
MATSRHRLGVMRRTEHAPITSDRIKHLAGLGLEDPTKLSVDEVRELCGSVLAHINRTVDGGKPAQ